MRIMNFQARNVRSFKEELNIELSTFNIFIGENSSGKSNLIALIRTALQSGNGTGINVPPFDGGFPETSNFSCLIEFNKEDVGEMSSTEAFNQVLFDIRSQQIPGTEKFRSDIELFNKQSSLAFSSSWSRQGNMTVRQSFPDIRNLVAPDQRLPMNTIIQTQVNYASRIFAITHQQILRNSIFISDTRDLQVNFPLGGQNLNNPIDASSILTFVTRWMLNERQTYDNFMTLVKRLLPRLADLQVEPSGNMANLFIRESNLINPLSGNELSKGSREILVLLGAIALARKSSVLLVEEPEIHLHPFAIRELKSIMLEAIEDKDLQIIISTHQPLFMDGIYPETDESKRIFKFENKDKSGNQVREIRTEKEISDLIDKLKLNTNH